MIVRKGLHFYWRMTRSLTMGAQGVVFDDQDRVLLIRHTYRKGWFFPGGGVEKNEGARLAVQRELEEEAGVLCHSEPRLFGLYTNFKSLPSDHIALFLIDEWTQPDPPGPNREIAEHGFFALSDLPEGTVGPVLRRLAEIKGEASQSELW